MGNEKYHKFTPQQDGRRKIMPEQHKEVRAKYKELKSQRQTAEFFGVSRRLIIFILYPERLKALQEHNRKTKHWKKYYNREQLTKATRNWRAKKKKLGLRIDTRKTFYCIKCKKMLPRYGLYCPIHRKEAIKKSQQKYKNKILVA